MSNEKPYDTKKGSTISWVQAPDPNYVGPVTTKVVRDITDRVSDFVRNGE